MIDHKPVTWWLGVLSGGGVWLFANGTLHAHPQDVPRRHYVLTNRQDEVIGGNYFRHRVTKDDTMILLARDNNLGFNEIMLANPTQDPWNPKLGSKIRLDFRKVLPGLNNPARIVVNLPEMRIYHIRSDIIDTYPIGVGQEGMMTPRVRTTVTHKQADPTWRPPASIRKENPSLPEEIPPGPRNPLGTHAIYLTLPSYLMHGTNRPLGVGSRVSHGCIRLYPEHIVDFFAYVKPGDSVAIVNEPVKAGWRDEELFLEVYPVLKDLKEEGGGLHNMMVKAVTQALSRRPSIQVVVDWKLAERMVAYPDGQSRRIAASEAAVASYPVRQAELTIPDIPEEQTIPPNGLILPDLDRLDHDEDDAARRAMENDTSPVDNTQHTPTPPNAPSTQPEGETMPNWEILEQIEPLFESLPEPVPEPAPEVLPEPAPEFVPDPRHRIPQYIPQSDASFPPPEPDAP